MAYILSLFRLFAWLLPVIVVVISKEVKRSVAVLLPLNSAYWCHLLITFANSLDFDRVGQKLGPDPSDLDPYCLKQLEANICSVIKYI